MKWIAADVETTGKDWTTCILHGVAISYELGKAKYHPAWDIPEQVKKDLENPKIRKIGQNFHGYDALVLRRHGINVQADEIDDPLVLFNVLAKDTKLDLKTLAEKYIGPESLDNKRVLDEYMASHGCSHVGQLCALDLADSTHPHFKVISKYGCEDILNTVELVDIAKTKMLAVHKEIKGMGFKKTPLDYYVEEARPIETVLLDMEYRGVRVDLNQLEVIKQDALSKMAAIENTFNWVFAKKIKLVENELYEREIRKLKEPSAIAKRAPGKGKSKFSWSNKNHVQNLLYKKLDLPLKLIRKTKTGRLKFDKDAIETLAVSLPTGHRVIPYLKKYQEYKLHEKIATTYTGTVKKGILSRVRTVNEQSRIFPHYRQTTETGRFACTNPNMQNIKRDSLIKKLFIPDSPDEVFDDADHNQVELRFGAHLSQDPTMCAGFRKGDDLHIATASRMFETSVTKADDKLRQAGKQTNFLTIFDGKAYRLQATLKDKTGMDFSIDECDEFIRVWFELYPGVRDYLDSQIEFMIRHGFVISEAGRIRYLPDIQFGQYIKYIKNPNPEYSNVKRVPRFTGPNNLRQDLVKSFLNRNKHLNYQDLDDNKIGWEAHKRFNHAIKAGLNLRIQSGAATLTKRGMIGLHKAKRKMVNQVHDSLIVSRKRGDLKAKQEVVFIMENAYKLTIPVVVDVKTVSTFHPNDKIQEDVQGVA